MPECSQKCSHNVEISYFLSTATSGTHNLSRGMCSEPATLHFSVFQESRGSFHLKSSQTSRHRSLVDAKPVSKSKCCEKEGLKCFFKMFNFKCIHANDKLPVNRVH